MEIENTEMTPVETVASVGGVAPVEEVVSVMGRGGVVEKEPVSAVAPAVSASMAIPEKGGVVVLGVTSAMTRAAALGFARRGYAIVAVSRDAEENEFILRDIRVRYNVPVFALTFDAEDFVRHDEFFEGCRMVLKGQVAGVLVGMGFLDEQVRVQADFALARRTIDVNYTAVVSLLERFARYFEVEQTDVLPEGQKPFIAAISSVAGDRGRQSNYIYGSAKAGLSVYLQGLRNRLFHAGITVTTIKPGFVDTKMTFGKEGLFLVAEPAVVGEVIAKSVCKGRGEIYVPWFWRYIMLILTHVPDCLFKRLHM